MVLEWTKTCCYIALKLNICIRRQVCVFIYIDNVFAKFHDNWSNVLHTKMDIPMFYTCVKRYASHKTLFSSEFVNTFYPNTGKKCTTLKHLRVLWHMQDAINHFHI